MMRGWIRNATKRRGLLYKKRNGSGEIVWAMEGGAPVCSPVWTNEMGYLWGLIAFPLIFEISLDMPINSQQHLNPLIPIHFFYKMKDADPNERFEADSVVVSLVFDVVCSKSRRYLRAGCYW